MGKTLYLIYATVLLSVVISATLSSYHLHRHPRHQKDAPLDFTSNASQLLRSSGFCFIATLLHISPDLFLSAPQSTIFAIPDSAMSNLSIPPYMTIQLITYHISPSKLTLQDLLKQPLHACFPTMFQQQRLSITKKDENNRALEINNVLITHPDLLIRGPVSIHGVSGPFASFRFHQEITELPICNTNRSEGSHSTVGAKLDLVKDKAEWGTVVNFLNSSGFAPFAIGLYSVLDGIVKEHPDLKSVTIFAPPAIEGMELPSPVLQKYVRAHIVPKKHSFKHLASMPAGSSLKTLCPGKNIEITGAVANLSDKLLSVNNPVIQEFRCPWNRKTIRHG